MRIVVTYDIAKDKVRRKVFRILESYGAWKQYSVFELEISDVQHVQMREKIRSVIGEQDRVRFYELCERCMKKITEIGEPSPEAMSNVV
ncbi:CRISPR-associated endonuclease Cas2 [Methanoculleus sp. Afa-1]|uniref:CRISPR-associated endoribonuclease Cas2 n=1 Tax=Methanoculleus formosensis TaxID=2590886 RepID=A0A9E4ZM86_9EURY|nr:CRISPR-associated endonuclease Cas2 [Methanoculleus sp. Afa-1]MCT8338313.1 CRISPR-associated endonuclease Cas2 [Methanoculleus sp. Afa-1]